MAVRPERGPSVLAAIWGGVTVAAIAAVVLGHGWLSRDGVMAGVLVAEATAACWGLSAVLLAWGVPTGPRHSVAEVAVAAVFSAEAGAVAGAIARLGAWVVWLAWLPVTVGALLLAPGVLATTVRWLRPQPPPEVAPGRLPLWLVALAGVAAPMAALFGSRPRARPLPAAGLALVCRDVLAGDGGAAQRGHTGARAVPGPTADPAQVAGGPGAVGQPSLTGVASRPAAGPTGAAHGGPAPDTFAFRYRLGIGDIAELVRYAPGLQRLRWALLGGAVPGLAAAVTGMSVVSARHDQLGVAAPPAGHVLALAAVGAAGVVFGWALTCLLPPLLARRQLQLMGAEPRQVTVHGGGVDLRTPRLRVRYGWMAFTRMRETSRSFLLIIGDAVGGPVVILPKRGLADPAQARQCAVFLRRGLASNRAGASARRQ